MSTILKALRRLEREKALPEDGRSLREAVATGGSEAAVAPRRSSWVLPLMALLLGVAFGAGLLLAWPGDGPIENSTAPAPEMGIVAEAPRSAEARPVPGGERRELARRVAPLAVPEPAAAPSDASETRWSSPVEVVARPERQPRIAPPEPSPAPAEVPPRPRIPLSRGEVLVAEAEVPEPDPWLLEPREAAPEPSPAPPVPEAIVAAPEPPAPAPAPEPAAKAPSSELTLRVVRTWWHPIAERREALVRADGEEQRLREGERLGDAAVSRIDVDAVVFRVDDRELVRRVGK